jgi:hypothetical protein
VLGRELEVPNATGTRIEQTAISLRPGISAGGVVRLLG